MSFWFRCPKNILLVALAILTLDLACAWLPDTKSKFKKNDEHGVKFAVNYSWPDHLIILHQDDRSITIGGRNTVYNLSLEDLTENRNQVRLEFHCEFNMLCSSVYLSLT